MRNFETRLAVEWFSQARRALLLALVVMVPLLVVYNNGLRDPFNTPKVALLIWGVTIVVAIRGAEIVVGARLAGLTRLMVPALCFSIPFFVAWLASPDQAFALWGWSYGRYQGLLPYLLVVAVGVFLADGFVGRAHQIVWSFGVAGSLVSIYAIAQFLGFALPGGLGGDFGFPSIAMTGNSLFTGSFIAISLSAIVPFAFGSGRKGRLARVMVYAMAIGLGRSYSQGAWVAGIAGIAIALGIALAPRWGPARMAGGLVAIFMAFSLVVAVIVALAGLDLEVLSTARSRGLTWETAIRATGDEPIFGHGLNSFGEVQHLYYTEEAAEDQRIRRSVPDDPHSVPLAMLVNGGLVTFLGFLIVVGWALVQAAKVPSGNVAGAGLVGAVTAYLVQSLTGIDEVTLRFAFWVCLGGLAAFNARELALSDLRPVRSTVGAMAKTVGSALFVFVAAVVSLGWALRFVEIHRT